MIICPICNEDLKLDDVHALSVCGHTYHRQCIESTLLANPVCPKCHRDAAPGDIVRMILLQDAVVQRRPRKTAAEELALLGHVRNHMGGMMSPGGDTFWRQFPFGNTPASTARQRFNRLLSGGSSVLTGPQNDGLVILRAAIVLWVREGMPIPPEVWLPILGAEDDAADGEESEAPGGHGDDFGPDDDNGAAGGAAAGGQEAIAVA